MLTPSERLRIVDEMPKFRVYYDDRDGSRCTETVTARNPQEASLVVSQRGGLKVRKVRLLAEEEK
jgi:hypothetical protein